MKLLVLWYMEKYEIYCKLIFNLDLGLCQCIHKNQQTVNKKNCYFNFQILASLTYTWSISLICFLVSLFCLRSSSILPLICGCLTTKYLIKTSQVKMYILKLLTLPYIGENTHSEHQRWPTMTATNCRTIHKIVSVL